MRISRRRRKLPATQDYSFITSATPEQVWATLTSPIRTPDFFYGLSAVSTWDIGAPIEFRTGAEDGVGDLVGQVVYAVPLGRLTYCVQPSPADPAVYLTWHLRGLPTGCVVRLEIDEPDAAELPGDEEETWLTLLAALQSLLSD